ncbi:hypothetical protein [Naasia aerilata]|uniref:Chemotaxis protein n=1 Tax=Naasia aerilata TaxID=1162966 RepID=A0ABM8GGK1_9MICO|nr:hypothetical protein [Naasia aerilata]BDZ47256.1 hypothetical protein GCM10025866_31650 [Naasia aerilata]
MNTQDTGRPDAGEPFDQTNALAGDQLGESDGTAEGERSSAADRSDAEYSFGDDGDPSLVDDPKRPIGDDNEPAILGRLLDDD